MLNRFRLWIDRVTMIISSILCALFMIIVVYNVAARYFFNGGIQWYMESSQYLNIWSVLVAGIGICASNDHLRVSIIDELLRGAPKKVFHLMAAIFSCAFYLFLAYSAFLLAGRSRQVISTMVSLKMSYVYWLIPVVATLSAFAVLLEIYCFLTAQNPVKEEKEEHDHLLID